MKQGAQINVGRRFNHCENLSRETYSACYPCLCTYGSRSSRLFVIRVVVVVGPASIRFDSAKLARICLVKHYTNNSLTYRLCSKYSLPYYLPAGFGPFDNKNKII